MKDKTNYAFPHKQSHEQFQYSETVHHGMTLRDYFAAKVMQGILSAQTEKRANGSPLYEDEIEYLTKEAFVVADAMLKQRIL